MTARTIGLSRLKVDSSASQYTGHTNRPYIGSNPLMTASEYAAMTRRVCTARYGTFDMAKPSQKQFDRTLLEVLTKIASGEYKLLCPIARKWVQDKRHGLREMLSIQWIEYYDVDQQQLSRLHRLKR